jgi:hypothetical protein
MLAPYRNQLALVQETSKQSAHDGKHVRHFKPLSDTD